MNIRTISVAIVLVAAFVASPYLPCSQAQPGTAASLSKQEYRAAFFGTDEKENTKRLNELAAQGWEYVGPLGNGMVAFHRRPVVVQRLRIVGTWEALAGQDKSRVEFTTDGKVKLTGDSRPLGELFETIQALTALKGNPDALSYELPEEGKFVLTTDYRKMGVAADDLEKVLRGPAGASHGIPVGPNRSFAEVAVGEEVLTISRPGLKESRSFKRVK